MSDTKTTRRDAARAVGLFLGTTQGRELFRRNHYLNDTRILAVPESEPIDSVIADHLDHGADTIVAVFFPDRQGSKRFGFFRWEMPSKQAPRRLVCCRRGDAWDRTSGPRIVHRCCHGYDEGSTFYSF